MAARRWQDPSVPPEVFEARRAQRSVARGVGDGDVPKPVRDRPGVDPIVGQLVAAGSAACGSGPETEGAHAWR
jgi:hypothetical protein